ncbi:transcription factor MYB3R-5-like [Olea europaea var. sylvestris]|uniref:transcription factor MYB3R-5-like n=1 Tax=Olea europaea var. sylvestris TaxID=158386 RepID=UPI000C1D8C5C|nr:transcription factor MYB3R-5-like [Olea europaea var. sylvestris]
MKGNHRNISKKINTLTAKKIEYRHIQQGGHWSSLGAGSAVAEFFPDRSEVQCLHRWQKVLNPELVKGPWTPEEDEKIVELVAKYGPTKWSVIAKSLPGRIGKQCRER